MSDLLSIGSTGVRAYQLAMNVVGENIANATTKGYARRSPALTELSAGAGSYILLNNLNIGQGVVAGGVARQWDEFRAADVRTGTSEASRTGSTMVWLDRMEKLLSGTNISGSLTRFFNAADGIAADPTGIAPRTAMLDAAGGVAAAFTATAEGLATIDKDLRASALQAVDQLSGFAAGLAEANVGLARVRPGSNEQAQLLDQRDRMIDEISALGSVHVSFDEKGVATVRINDSSGPVLVQGANTRKIGAEFNASGTLGMVFDPIYAPEAFSFRSGAIAGFAEANARLTDMRTQIADLATAVADGVNQVQAAGVDLNGAPGAALFDASAGGGILSVTTAGARQIAAARPWTVSGAAGNGGSAALQAATAPSGTPLASTRLTVSGGVLTALDPVTNSVIGTAPYTPGTPVTLAGLSLTVSGTAVDGDSFTVAATRPGSRDNGNLAGFAALRSGARYEGQANDLVNANASALAAKKQVAEAQNVILEGALAARDAVSGVNLDNEAVELMRFQQAYSASSRIIQVARDTFDSLLQAVS
ncbi:flagellar hook-associated protein FlgK [Sphingomonas sp. ID1715]|uniref:flagellar hook-associated protein FlgK n=1 Tax=Sphingomonas sp. ID1715 TaxID=1656898 RepID=UPI0014897B9C|nr:flagellar basal body rod C-terminal domain-containing protein [Sphingomonas sp. ID1715]NNM77074.1 flagellar hook-associated protein FlgK [Sphingomonas sp. ID1715]